MKLKDLIKRNEFLYFWARVFQNCSQKEYRKWVIDIIEHPALVRIDHAGELFPNKLVYFVDIDDKGNNSGFFALWNNTIKRLQLAYRLHAVPVICWRNTAYSSDENENVFENYFLQPGAVTCAEALKCSNLVMSKPNDGFSNIEGFIYDEQMDYFSTVVRLCKEYLKLAPKIEEQINIAQNALLPNCEVLGVHVRGTDFKMGLKGHPQRVLFEEYIAEAKKRMKEAEAKYIFLATDDKNALRLFKKEFGDKLLYYEDSFYGEGNMGLHYMAGERNRHKYLLGYEVIRDVYTLASCRYLIAGLSHVSFASRVINKAFKEPYQQAWIINKGINQAGITSKQVNKKYL